MISKIRISWIHFREHKLHFSEEGEAGTLYIKPIDYLENIEALDTLVDNMAKETTLIRSIDSWTTEFKAFLKELDPTSQEEFRWNSLDRESFQVHEKLFCQMWDGNTFTFKEGWKTKYSQRSNSPISIQSCFHFQEMKQSLGTPVPHFRLPNKSQ